MKKNDISKIFRTQDNPPVISTVTVTYWTGEVLFRCITSLQNQNVDEIILVDNGNPANIAAQFDKLAEQDPRIKILRPRRNIGFAAGCNLGARQASGRFITFVNPDCVLAPDTVERILGVATSRQNIWLCGGRLENPDGSEQRGSRREILTPWRAVVELLRLDRFAPNHPYFRRYNQFENEPVKGNIEVPVVSGAFMMVRKDAFERLGGMDETFFLHFDDADFCMRVWEEGGQVIFCADIPIMHYRSSSDVSRTFIEWHKAKGIGYFFRKHFAGIYPGWSLSIVSWLVWIRFIAILPHRLVYELPDMLRRHWRHRNDRQFTQKYLLSSSVASENTTDGIDRDGFIFSQARIPVTNQTSTTATTLELNLDGVKDHTVRVEIDGKNYSQVAEYNKHISLTNPVTPGDRRWLTITLKKGTRARFVNAQLLGTGITSTKSVAHKLVSPGLIEKPANGPFVRIRGCTVSIPATDTAMTLKHSLLRRRVRSSAEHVLLHNINLDAAAGDRIGIIGRNGVGKTSFLRLVAGIYPPVKGTRHVQGRITPILALGRGIDPELNLRANIALGLIQNNRNDLYSEDLVSQIIEFAELEGRAYEPMRSLSARLQARFALSLMIHQKPNIFILDDVFVLGDTAFMERAKSELLNRIDDTTILFITSNEESQIKETCSRAILLHDGRIEMDATPEAVFAAYHKQLTVR